MTICLALLVKAAAQSFRISPEPSPRRIWSTGTLCRRANSSASMSAYSSGYRQARLKPSVIAFKADADGPYGFSFELRRTTCAAEEGTAGNNDPFTSLAGPGDLAIANPTAA